MRWQERILVTDRAISHDTLIEDVVGCITYSKARRPTYGPLWHPGALDAARHRRNPQKA